MFERIMKYDQFSRMLKIQYRMHEDIANWASDAMYHGKLLRHDTVKSRKLFHLSHVDYGVPNKEKSSSDDVTPEDLLLPSTRNSTLLRIDTAGCDTVYSNLSMLLDQDTMKERQL